MCWRVFISLAVSTVFLRDLDFKLRLESLSRMFFFFIRLKKGWGVHTNVRGGQCPMRVEGELRNRNIAEHG